MDPIIVDAEKRPWKQGAKGGQQSHAVGWLRCVLGVVLPRRLQLGQ